MINAYVILKGGMGNQLFQYSYAFFLKKNYNYNVFLIDITKFFPIKRILGINFLNFKIIKGNILFFYLYFIAKFISRYYLINKLLYFIGIKFESEFNQLPSRGNSLFDGYWQDYRYLSDELKSTINAGLHQSFQDIKFNSNYDLCVHIRCGDYLNNDSYYICTPDWYIKSILVCAEKLKYFPKVIIFTDDIDWVKNNVFFPFEVSYYYSPNNNDIEDFYIMTKYKNFIISNSTFSWWASYLGSDLDSLIIVPKFWMKDKEFKNTNLFIPGLHTIV